MGIGNGSSANLPPAGFHMHSRREPSLALFGSNPPRRPRQQTQLTNLPTLQSDHPFTQKRYASHQTPTDPSRTEPQTHPAQYQYQTQTQTQTQTRNPKPKTKHVRPPDPPGLQHQHQPLAPLNPPHQRVQNPPTEPPARATRPADGAHVGSGEPVADDGRAGGDDARTGRLRRGDVYGG